jgi:threonine dehydrogenase-like Zn-dependent dehydrogenase
MKALVYQGPGCRAWEDRTKPTIMQATDAIVRITTTTICGTDLHILKGDLPTVTSGRILGDIVAIVGAGPVGLAALLTAQLYSPAEIMMIDLDGNRLEVARSLGATKVVNGSDGQAVERIMALTNAAGVDVAIEAVGIPATFDICQSIIAPGGRIANVGVHGKPVEFHIERLWSYNITLTTRLVDTVTTPMLLRIVQSGRLDAKKLVSHRFELSEIMKAYDTFGNAAKERALKVVLKNARARGKSLEGKSKLSETRNAENAPLVSTEAGPVTVRVIRTDGGTYDRAVGHPRPRPWPFTCT